MKVLFIGGTGEISFSCVAAAMDAGHEVSVFNRGMAHCSAAPGARQIVGDITDDDSYSVVGQGEYDIICQFLAFVPETIQRDIELFSGRCQQYIFISSASVYQKPIPYLPITENMAIGNPYLPYSRKKAACEQRLLDAQRAGELPVIIVRPSHTYRTRLPSTIIHGDHLAWRVLKGKKIIVHGDGESVWTLTHSDDFARALVGLFGKEDAIGQDFHITETSGQTWRHIIECVADTIGKPVEICPIASRKLIEYDSSWEGPLLGDKSNSLIFDNQKIRQALGSWSCAVPLAEGLKRAWSFVEKRLEGGYAPDAELDDRIDSILGDQGY